MLLFVNKCRKVVTQRFGINLNLQKVWKKFECSKFKSFATSRTPVFWLLIPITFCMVFNDSVSHCEEPL